MFLCFGGGFVCLFGWFYLGEQYQHILLIALQNTESNLKHTCSQLFIFFLSPGSSDMHFKFDGKQR